jgi:hypothetical protein
MLIISRSEAIKKKLSRYFTGEPCKHGHISQRYTKTAGCIECVHPSFEAADLEVRKRIKTEMITKKFRVYNSDLELFEMAVLSAAILREPAIMAADIQSRLKPVEMAPDRFIRGYRIFPQDEESLRSLETGLESKHPAPQTPWERQRNIEPEAAVQWPEEDPR